MAVLAYIFATLKSIIYGLTVFFVGDLTETVDVLQVLALRFLVSFFVLWLLKTLRIIRVKTGFFTLVKKAKRDAGARFLLLAAFFEPVAYMLFETLGISMSRSITTAVLLSLAPVACCLCEKWILKQNVPLSKMILLGIGMVGVIYIAVNTNTSDGKDTVWGMLFLVLAVLSGAMFLTFSNKSATNYSTMEITYVAATMGMIIFNAANVVNHLIHGTIASYFTPFFSVDNLLSFLFLGVGSTVVATSMCVFAAGKLPPSTMSAFGGVSTLATVVVGALFYKEPIYFFHYVGLSLILIRMIGVIWLERSKEKALDH